MDRARILEVDHGSDLYRKTVDLRLRVLREPIGLSFSEEELDAEVGSIHLALTTEDAVIACLVLVEKPGGEIKMRQVAVDFGRQSQGYGRRLVQESERLCLARKANLITLHARQSAVSFYERMGYQIEGEEFIEVGVPHRKMSKSLTACHPSDTAE